MSFIETSDSTAHADGPHAVPHERAKPSTLSDTSWISEGLTLVAASGFGYLAAFSYETGFASHFRIPREFVLVDVQTLVSLGIPACTVVYIIYLLADFSTGIHHISKTSAAAGGIAKFVLKQIISLSFIILFLALGGWNWGDIDWMGWAILALVVLPDYLGILVFRMRSPKRTWNEAISDWLKPSPDEPPRLFSKLPLQSQTVLFVALLAYSGLALAFQVGRGEARSLKSFAVTSDGYAMIRRYGDSLMFAKLSPDRKRLEPIFMKVPTAQHSSPIELQFLGKLPATDLTGAD